jgi:hypothetical protein
MADGSFNRLYSALVMPILVPLTSGARPALSHAPAIVCALPAAESASMRFCMACGSQSRQSVCSGIHTQWMQQATSSSGPPCLLRPTAGGAAALPLLRTLRPLAPTAALAPPLLQHSSSCSRRASARRAERGPRTAGGVGSRGRRECRCAGAARLPGPVGAPCQARSGQCGRRTRRGTGRVRWRWCL